MTSVKDFQVISKLGEGAYSSVYKVKRLEDKEEYALKRVNMQNLSEKEKQNALNEVRILASVRNPNIICYKEAFLDENSNSLCIIMEYADNGDLFQKISENQKKNRSFQEEEVWNVIIQVVKGLKALHDLKIFHRDLKSANVFMNKDGTVKLGDMNVSKVAKKGLLYTQTGTPYPEVWKEQPYDHKSDLWSLGCVIYEMTTLRPPFKANDMMGLYKKVIRGQYPRISSQYSQDLQNIIKGLLQVSPQLRPSCDKILSLQSIQKRLDNNKYMTEADEGSQSLLKTIIIPRKFHYLTSVLPKPNYEPMKIKVKGKPRSLSQIGSGLNLPALVGDGDDISMNNINNISISNKHQRYASEMKDNTHNQTNNSNKLQLPKIFNNLYAQKLLENQQSLENKRKLLSNNQRINGNVRVNAAASTNSSQLPAILMGTDRQKQLNSRYNSIQKLLLMVDKQKMNDEKKIKNSHLSLEKKSKIIDENNESFESIKEEEENRFSKLKNKRISISRKSKNLNSSLVMNENSLNSQLQQQQQSQIDIADGPQSINKIKTERLATNNTETADKEKMTEKELQQKLENLLTKQIDGKYVENLQKKAIASKNLNIHDPITENLLKSIKSQQINYFKYSSIPLKSKKLNLQKIPHQLKEALEGSSNTQNISNNQKVVIKN